MVSGLMSKRLWRMVILNQRRKEFFKRRKRLVIQQMLMNQAERQIRIRWKQI